MAEERRNALTPGTEFEGYRIESILGAGGFGVTYRATETLLNRTVAIKEFLPGGMVVREADRLTLAPVGASEAGDFDWGMDRFRQEAQTLVAFRHPNIVTVFRYFETNGTGYLVMEFVEGRTLADLLRADNVLPEHELREILDPLLDGLEAVHDKGFLHRDIKPANIFIREDGAPVLIDFGAARMAMGQHSKSLTSIISAGYAPYEQYDSSATQGPWTDLYALGGVLYRSVTGQLPVEAPARVSAVFGGGGDPMPPAAQAAKTECSPALLAAIDGALAIREADRPRSVAAFRDMLKGGATVAAAAPRIAAAGTGAGPDRAATDQPTLLAGGDPGPVDPSAPTVSRPPPAARKPSRWKVAAPAALLLLAAAGGMWALLSGGESEACLRIARQMDDAVGRADLAAARRHLGAARAGRCSQQVLATLDLKTQALAGRLAAEAERKRQEDARRQAAEARKMAAAAEAERRRLEEERRKAEAEAARKQAAAEAERKRLADERRKAEAEAARKQAEEEARKKAAADAERRRQAEVRQKAAEARRKALAGAERKRREEERRKAAEEAEREREVEKRHAAMRKWYADEVRLKCVSSKEYSETECNCLARVAEKSTPLAYIEYAQKLSKIASNKSDDAGKKWEKVKKLDKEFGRDRNKRIVKKLMRKAENECGIDLDRKNAAKNQKKQDEAKRREDAAVLARHLSECRWGWDGRKTVGWVSRIGACSAIIEAKALTGPKLAAIYYARGLARRQAGDGRAANADFQAAANLDPANGDYRRAAGQASAGTDAGEARDAEAAKAVLARHLSECRWGWDGKRRLGWRARVRACSAIIDSGRFAGADRAKYHFYRGNAYRSARRFRSAKQDYRAASDLDPGNRQYRRLRQ